MKYLSILLLLFTSFAMADETQTNVSGSNTSIDGGYTSSATTTYQSGSSSNTTTNSTSVKMQKHYGLSMTMKDQTILHMLNV
jgi:hypothetical protein